MSLLNDDIKNSLLKEFVKLDDINLADIECWINSKKYERDMAEMKKLDKPNESLKKVAKFIKTLVPFEAEMSTEKIQAPIVGDQKDCNERNCCHVDEFLYDDRLVQSLVIKGKLHRHYCKDCESKDIKEIKINHYGLSRVNVLYIFKVQLPRDLSEKQILNIGSGLGSVIYTAHYNSNAKLIISMDLDKKCCEIQENIVEKFSMSRERIKIVNGNIFERDDVVQNSDVIIINLAEYFQEIKEFQHLWVFLKKNVQKGTYIVSNKSISEKFHDLELYEQYVDYLSICKPCQPENEIFFDLNDIMYCDLHLYKVD